jgi:hypothetical protein
VHLVIEGKRKMEDIEMGTGTTSTTNTMATTNQNIIPTNTNDEDTEETSIILQMAQSGIPIHPWVRLSPIVERKMLKCLDDFSIRLNNGNKATNSSNNIHAVAAGYESTMSENTSESTFGDGIGDNGVGSYDAIQSLNKMKEELTELLRGFYNAPFTIQRICELILNPSAHYKSLDALCRGFEILLSVSSTIPVGTQEDVARLQQEYKRVVSTIFPANNVSNLKRTDTVEMDID